MHRIVPALSIALLLAACGREGGGGAATTRDYPVVGFDRIAAAGAVDVEIHSGGPFHVQAEGSQDALDRLGMKVVDGQLAIGNKPGSSSFLSFFSRGNGRVHVRITMPTIRAADLSGAGAIVIDRVASERFESAIAGSGDIRIGALQAGSARFAIAGAGDITAAGAVRQLEVSMTGAGNMRAPQLAAGDIQINISGAGNLETRATGRVTGQLSGVGNVEITGTRDCNVGRSGVGVIKCEA